MNWKRRLVFDCSEKNFRNFIHPMPLPSEIWNTLQRHLFPISSCLAARLFNPYHTVEPGLDRPAADSIRRENLKRYVECFVRPPRYLLVGEAPGWRGCRFSGVPFTSEAQLVEGTLPFAGRQSSNA